MPGHLQGLDGACEGVCVGVDMGVGYLCEGFQHNKQSGGGIKRVSFFEAVK